MPTSISTRKRRSATAASPLLRSSAGAPPVPAPSKFCSGLVCLRIPRHVGLKLLVNQRLVSHHHDGHLLRPEVLPGHFLYLLWRDRVYLLHVGCEVGIAQALQIYVPKLADQRSPRGILQDKISRKVVLDSFQFRFRRR